MPSPAKALSKDNAALKVALLTATARTLHVEAELANAKAQASDDQAMIAYQQLQIAKLRHQLYGQRSERSVRLIEQLTLAFEELESAATADEIAAEQAAARTTGVAPFTRKRPSPASARRASPSPSICHASAWSSPRPPPACAAAVPTCASWARTSRRRWK